MKLPIRHPDGQEFGPYTIEELERMSREGAYPPNTEVFANGEWVSLGGFLVVRKRVEQIQAAEASRPRAAPVPSAPELPQVHPKPEQRGLAKNQTAIFVGVGLFVLVISLAILLR